MQTLPVVSLQQFGLSLTITAKGARAASAVRYVMPWSRLRALLILLLCLSVTSSLRADAVSGTVKDPSGADVAGARIEITGGNLSQAIVLVSDESGKFSAANLSPGKYTVKVVKEGFEEVEIAVELHGIADVPVKLVIAEVQVSINVSEKSLAFLNSDAVYRQLRDIKAGDSYRVENFSLPMDVGTFQLKSG